MALMELLTRYHPYDPLYWGLTTPMRGTPFAMDAPEALQELRAVVARLKEMGGAFSSAAGTEVVEDEAIFVKVR
jgi:hypothetical protein